MVVVHFTTITGSSSTSRWRVTRVPISSPVSPPLVSSLCSQRVLAVSSRDLQGPITCCRNIAKLQSFIVHSSSNHVLNAIPVSSLFRRCITNVSSKSCQNTAKYFTTVLLPLHRSIIQTTKHIAKPVSEPPPISVEALSRPVVSISSIHRQRITASFFECHPLHIGALPSHCHSVLTTLSLLFAVSSARYLFSSQCPHHAISSLRSVTSPSPIPRQGVSPTHSPCVLQHHKSASSLRQYVTNSSSKYPLVPGILSKTLPKHCQSTFRESCLIKSFSTRRQIISDELPVLSLSRPRSSTSSRS